MYRLTVAGLLAGSLLCPAPVGAQSLTASGGASSFLDASGLAFNYKWAPFSGWFGAGFTPGFQVGGFVGATYHGTQVGVGDRFYPFVLDTDVLDRSYYFDGLGLSVSRHGDEQSWMVFAGVTASEFSTPFLRTFQPDQPAGAVFYERQLTPRFTFHSSNIFRSEMTSIQSVGVRLRPHWKVGAAGGIGTGHGFAAAATEYKNKWLGFDGSYTVAGDHFQRIRIPSPLLSERRGLNARLRFSPFSNLNFELDHENILSPTVGKAPPLRASLDSVNAFTLVRGFGVGAGASVSHAGAFVTETQVLNVSRRLRSWFTSYGAAFRVHSQNTKPVSLYLGTVEEKLSPRLSVDQTVSYTNSSTSLSAGGSFLSNPVSVAIHYQTVFTPLAGGFNGRPFIQAWTLSLRIQMPRGIQLRYDNYIDPFGKVRYTAFASGIGYARNGEPIAVAAVPAQPIYAFVVRGRAQDERGQPVWGVAVQIDGRLVYSDSQGEFFLRFKNRGEYPLTVATEYCLSPGLWKVVSAPAMALADKREKGTPVRIVVSRQQSHSDSNGRRGVNP
jgi:hypothetical protein